MKKRTEGRTIILHLQAKAALQRWLCEQQGTTDSLPTMYLFQSREGINRPISRVQAWRILEQAYLTNARSGKLGTHSMRKTFANRIYDKLEHDLIKTQRALGHRNINSTVSYLSFREEEIDEAILAV